MTKTSYRAARSNQGIRSNNPTLILLRTLNLHTQRIRNTNENLAFRNLNFLHAKVAKHLQCLEVRTAAEDTTDDEIVDRLAKTDVNFLHLEVCLVFSEDVLERFARDVAAGMDVEVLESQAGVSHQGFETGGSETDPVGVLTRLGGVDVTAFVQVDVDERGVKPAGEEIGEAVIGEGGVVRQPELGEVLAVVVDIFQYIVREVMDRCKRESAETGASGIKYIRETEVAFEERHLLVEFEAEVCKIRHLRYMVNALRRDLLVVADLQAMKIWAVFCNHLKLLIAKVTICIVDF